MSGIRRLALTLAALCVAVAATAGTAAATPVRLDPSFGKGGKVTVAFPAGQGGGVPKYELPFAFDPGHLQMAQAPGGKIVVAGATKIVRLLADGKLDPSFGSGGAVRVRPPAGSVFVLSSVAVDSEGRILLAGLTRPLPTNTVPDPLLSSAALMRFDADGRPDPSFGGGGTLVTEFGFGAPQARGSVYPGASVGLRDVVIDSEDRPVVSGAYVTDVGGCTNRVDSAGFVARLTGSGALDPTFGEGGIRTLTTLASVRQVAARPGGYLALAAGGPLCEGEEVANSLLTDLGEKGNLQPSFGAFGFGKAPYGNTLTMAIAPSGKILLLGRPRRSSEVKRVTKTIEGKPVTEKVHVTTHFQVLTRLLPGGASDPSLAGEGGVSLIDRPHHTYTAIAADQEERVYVMGKVDRRVSKASNDRRRRTSFYLGRTNPNGYFDRSFGYFGEATIGFGKATNSFATQVMIDPKGRVLVGGGITSPRLGSGGGFAIARFLPRP